MNGSRSNLHRNTVTEEAEDTATETAAITTAAAMVAAAAVVEVTGAIIPLRPPLLLAPLRKDLPVLQRLQQAANPITARNTLSITEARTHTLLMEGTKTMLHTISTTNSKRLNSNSNSSSSRRPRRTSPSSRAPAARRGRHRSTATAARPRSTSSRSAA